MFTGLVEEVGTIHQIIKRTENMTLTIQCTKILEDMHVGDSISVNGVCLTVTVFDEYSFQVDVIHATNDITLFSSMKRGDKVNLERACLPTTRLGGHIVSGHIDTSLSLTSFKRNTLTFNIQIQIPKSYLMFVIPKGSICINGISLTIFELNNGCITLNIIPETVRSTNLQYLKQGDYVHVEFDMVGKYILNQNVMNNVTTDTQLLKKLELM